MNIIFLVILILTLGTIVSGYIKSDNVSFYFGWKTFIKGDLDTFTLGITQNAFVEEDGKNYIEVFIIGLYFVGFTFVFKKKIT